MWEAIANIFTSESFLSSIPSVILFVVVIGIAVKLGIIKVKTDHVQIGTMSSEREHRIMQEQCDFAHTYLMGLLGKVDAVIDGPLQYNGWFAKCILEGVYDEIVRWITQNHITDDEAYVSTKQNKICALVYSYNVMPEYKTPEFQERMKKWVAEVISELVRIRKVYMKQEIK